MSAQLLSLHCHWPAKVLCVMGGVVWGSHQPPSYCSWQKGLLMVCGLMKSFGWGKGCQWSHQLPRSFRRRGRTAETPLGYWSHLGAEEVWPRIPLADEFFQVQGKGIQYYLPWKPLDFLSVVIFYFPFEGSFQFFTVTLLVLAPCSLDNTFFFFIMYKKLVLLKFHHGQRTNYLLCGFMCMCTCVCVCTSGGFTPLRRLAESSDVQDDVWRGILQ